MRKVVYLLLVLCAACARPPAPVWQPLPTAEQLLARVAAQKDRFLSLDAAASVSLEVAGKVRSSQQFLLLERPDRVRADVLTGFGQLVLQLASDGKQLSVLLNTQTPRRFFRGPASDANLARFTRLPLPAASLIQLLLYDPPLIAVLSSEVRVQGDHLLLRLAGKQRRQELWFDAQQRLVASRYFKGDQLLLEVHYDKLTAVGFPSRMVVNLAREQIRASLRLSDIKTNGTIAPKKFVLQPPEGVAVELLP